MNENPPFDRTLPEALAWLDEIAAELAVDRVAAHRALLAVLHAVRDHLSPTGIAALAMDMPLVIRELFMEGTGAPREVPPGSGYEGLLEQVSRSLATPSDPDRAHTAIEAVARLLDRNAVGGDVFRRSVERKNAA